MKGIIDTKDLVYFATLLVVAPLPDAALGRVGALEVARGSVGLALRPPRPALPRLRLRRHALVASPATDPYVLAEPRRSASALAASLYLAFGLENLRGLLGQRSTRYGASAVALLAALRRAGRRRSTTSARATTSAGT